MSFNFVKREFHKSEDCVLGECLKVIGRKFKKVISQNFVKINGPADCWVHKCCSPETCKLIVYSKELQAFKNFGRLFGDGFRKKPNLIVEPEKGYDGPDYKGTNKHGGKAYGHTPSAQYNVRAFNTLFAVGYLDIDRQKRTGNIELIKIELIKEYSKNI